MLANAGPLVSPRWKGRGRAPQGAAPAWRFYAGSQSPAPAACPPHTQAPEKMAMCQKAMVSACSSLGKPSIITRVVDTMIRTPRPTRCMVGGSGGSPGHLEMCRDI